MTDVRYFLDEHLDPPIVQALIAFNVPATSAGAEGRLHLLDESHLEWALTEGWVIVTRDKDYLQHHQNGVDHAGIVYCPGRHRHSIGDYAKLLAAIAVSETMESMYQNLRFL